VPRLALMLLPGLLAALPAGRIVSAPRAELGAGSRYPGTALTLRFRPSPQSISPSASAFSQKARFYWADTPTAGAFAYALLALPLEAKPGPHSLRVDWLEDGVPRRERIRFTVARRPGKLGTVHLAPKALKAMDALGEEKPLLEAAFHAAEGPPLWRGRFLEPVPATRVSDPFGTERRYLPGGSRSRHKGLDLAIPLGTPVAAANDGVVILARQGLKAYGGLVVISHGYGLCSSYLHLSRVTAQKGQRLAKGEILGLSGSEGISSGPHLHWELTLRGYPIDPMPWMDKAGLAALK
jgi:murein DD-endopeptidase MepM/ murein hydrolase activator NlpD